MYSLNSFADNAYQQPNPMMYGSDGQTQMYDPNNYYQQYYDPNYYYYQQYPVDPMYQGQEQFSEQQQQLPEQHFQDQQLQQTTDQQQYQGHLSPGQHQQHHQGFQDPQLLQQPQQATPDYQVPDQQPQVEQEHHFQGVPEQSQPHQEEQHTQDHHQLQQLSAHSTPIHGLHLEDGGELGPAEHQQREPVDGGNDEVSTSVAPSAPVQPDYDDNLQLPMERLVLVRPAKYLALNTCIFSRPTRS